MRPCDSVAGTRCTRCTPPSYFSFAHTGVARPAGAHRDGRRLDAAQVGRLVVEHLGRPALPLGVAQVHPQQVAGEQRRLVAALARLDLEDDVLAVVGVLGQQQLPQPRLELGDAAGQGLGLGGEGRVLGGEFARGAEVARAARRARRPRRRSARVRRSAGRASRAAAWSACTAGSESAARRRRTRRAAPAAGPARRPWSVTVVVSSCGVRRQRRRHDETAPAAAPGDAGAAPCGGAGAVERS